MDYTILGSGILALTLSLELSTRHPTAKITIVAKHLVGDKDKAFASPWAGANWCSAATDGGRMEEWDRVTYLKFWKMTEEAKGQKEMGVHRMMLKGYFDNEIEDSGVLSETEKGGEGRIWYEELCRRHGGWKWLEDNEVPEGAKWGFEMGSFVVDVQVYLPWLQNEARKKGIQFHRRSFEDIQQLFDAYPNSTAYFNCTGLGSYSLKGVEDKNLYPTRGQILLVENPTTPLTKMYFRSPQRVNKDTTYVFPRGLHGGVVLGGCRIDNEWNGDVDLEFAEDIKRRCCELAPELGRPEDLMVLSHGVGLRPSRKGGARVEKERINGRIVVHNYGAGGAGYQASWGMAKEAVDLLQKESKL